MKKPDPVKRHSELEKLALKWAKAKLRFDEWLMRDDRDPDMGQGLNASLALAELDLFTTCVRILSKEKNAKP